MKPRLWGPDNQVGAGNEGYKRVERRSALLAALSEDASAVGAAAHSVPKPIRSNLETVTLRSVDSESLPKRVCVVFLVHSQPCETIRLLANLA